MNRAEENAYNHVRQEAQQIDQEVINLSTDEFIFLFKSLVVVSPSLLQTHSDHFRESMITLEAVTGDLSDSCAVEYMSMSIWSTDAPTLIFNQQVVQPSPRSPDEMDWSPLYPKHFKGELTEDERNNSSTLKRVEFADVGCGYGGLLVTLSTMFPESLILGMEIRVKVSEYVMKRIEALRNQHPNQYDNIACIRTNAMKYLPNFFHKGQLKKMFFLYPDPHFKKSKHKWRIISTPLIAEYAYILSEGGIIYTVTDVQDLHHWMIKHLEEHPLFERLSEDEVNKDPISEKLLDSTEEGQKVTRNKGDKFLAIFRRVPDPFLL